MRVRMLTSMAGEHNLEEGREYDLPADLGKALCSEPEDHPRAEPVATKPADRAEKRATRS